MRFVLTIECDNAAFGGPDDEVRRTLVTAACLERIADNLRHGPTAGPVMDTNGNTVGRFGFETEPGETDPEDMDMKYGRD
jgi:hypothetical protein